MRNIIKYLIVITIMFILGCRQTLFYSEKVDGNTIVPVYSKCAFSHSSKYYTSDGKKTHINLSALGYDLENRIFTKKTLNDLSIVIETLYPEMNIIKIYPFDIKDREKNCGLFYLALINNTTKDSYYEMPIIFIDETNIQIEYQTDNFQNIANDLFEKGFNALDLELREGRFSMGIVEKPFIHVHYYW